MRQDGKATPELVFDTKQECGRKQWFWWFLKGRRSQVVKAGVCKTLIRRFESARRLQFFKELDYEQ